MSGERDCRTWPCGPVGPRGPVPISGPLLDRDPTEFGRPPRFTGPPEAEPRVPAELAGPRVPPADGRAAPPLKLPDELLDAFLPAAAAPFPKDAPRGGIYATLQDLTNWGMLPTFSGGQLEGLTMRTLLTFTALMLMSTAALAADRYCANQGTPDEMVMTEDGDLHIKSATGTETLTWAMSVGAGFNGRIYTNARGDTEVVNDTTIEMVSGPKTTIEKQIYLFRDRVFWPCDEPRYENTAAN